tara:strand:- start:23 stop:241 length:219 start_codon:yes stop_codon:yes gene_type:complete
MKIVPSNTYFWDTGSEKLDVTQMRTTHLINAVVLTNRMMENSGHEPPECYDAMYVELNYRGVDTDAEIDFDK